MVIDKNVLLIIVWLLYVIYMVARIYKNVKEARAIKTRKQVIDKACEWLKMHLAEWSQFDDKDLEIFRKAMEEE